MSNSEEKQEFDYERISLLFENTATGYLGMAAAASCMAYLIGYLSTPFYAWVWLGLLFLTYLPRMVMSVKFNRLLAADEIERSNAAPWEKWFFLASIAPFLCFGSAVFIPYGENSLIAMMYYSSVSLALVAGGIITYSTSLPAIMLFLHLALLPLIFRIFFIPDLIATTMGITLTVCYILLIRLIPTQNKVLLENIALKIENKSQSLTDPLTQLSNRRRLQMHMENLIPVARRQKEPFSIILLDIDHFKKYNDEHGHSAGDELLVEFSQILKECSRDQDLVVRYGGEEFLLVLPSTDVDAAMVLTERINKTVKERTSVTVSAGLAMHSDDIPFDELVRKADSNLYSAKSSGRDSYKA